MKKPLLNQEVLDSYRELQSEDDPHFLRNYLEIFLNEAPKQLENLRLSIADKNPQKLARAAHAMKSSFLGLGVTPIVNISSTVERLANEGVVTNAQNAYSEIVRLYGLLRTEINELPEFKNKSKAA